MHIAISVFVGIVSAFWFLSFLERRRIAKIRRRAAELLRPAPQPVEPVEMYFAEPTRQAPAPPAPGEPLSFADKIMFFGVCPYFAFMVVLAILYYHDLMPGMR
jgi:hypothetical protein